MLVLWAAGIARRLATALSTLSTPRLGGECGTVPITAAALDFQSGCAVLRYSLRTFKTVNDED